MAKAKKLPSGSWRVQVYSHTEKADGKEKKIMRSFTAPTKKEAEFLAAQFTADKGRKKDPVNITLGEAIDEYIASCEGTRSPTTIDGYRRIRKNFFSNYMDMPLRKINSAVLQEMVDLELRRPMRSKAKTPTQRLSPKTLRNAYGLVATAIREAAPGIDTRVKLPQKENAIKELIPPEVVMQIVKDTRIELPCLLSMWLSLSMSEIRGLTKSGSIRDGYLSVNQVVVTVDGEHIAKKQAKTYTRTRKLKIPPYIQKLCDQVETDQLVTMSGQAIYKAWSRLLEKNGLPHMTFHDLRHENASIMAMLNVPEKYAMERGGWKTPAVMKRVYTHTFSAERKSVDEKIDNFFEQFISHEISHEK